MSSAMVIQGFVKPDGTLELAEKVTLPPGRGQVTLVPLPELPKDDPFWQMMEGIWAGQKARGHIPRSNEEVEAERRVLRENGKNECGGSNRFSPRRASCSFLTNDNQLTLCTDILVEILS